MRIFIYLSLFGCGTLSFAQTKSASFYYQNFEYKQAAQLWEKEANLERATQEKLLVCYLNTQQGAKGLKLVDQMRSVKDDGQLAYFAAQFAFQAGLYERALQEAKQSRAISPSALPLMFEQNCDFASKSIRSIDGHEEEAIGNSIRAEHYYQTAGEQILLKEVGYDSLLNVASLGNNFEEVFFLRPHLLRNGEWQEWKAIAEEFPYFSMNSLQIDSKNNIAYFTASQPLKQSENEVGSKLFKASFNGFEKSLSNIAPLALENVTGTVGYISMSEDGHYLVITNYAQGDSSSNLVLLENVNGEWKNAKPMNELNTAGDEIFPNFIGNDLLRFSSNGRPGFGDLDVYQANFNKGKSSNVIHLEQPINGLADDFLVYGTLYDTLTFTSNRSAGKGDDDIWNYYPKIEVIAIIPKVDTVLPAINVAPQRLYFDYKIATTSQKAKDIEQLMLALERSPEKMLVVTGNADPRGTDVYNEDLAMRRAVFVKNELVKAGIDQNRIRTISEGERLAAPKNHTKEAEFKLDRYVEITVK